LPSSPSSPLPLSLLHEHRFPTRFMALVSPLYPCFPWHWKCHSACCAHLTNPLWKLVTNFNA
jgi:hypothetical protein